MAVPHDRFDLDEFASQATCGMKARKILVRRELRRIDKNADHDPRRVPARFPDQREVPGMQVVQSGSFGGTTSLFLRGGQSNYTKVLIDGVPANAPGGAFDLAFLSTDNVDRCRP